MVRIPHNYGVILVRGEDGRVMAYFPDLPEAVTDGADEAEALAEAADCLSEALASRIVDGEEIPLATEPGQYRISPDPTIALKVALYSALRQRDMTVADLADLLEAEGPALPIAHHTKLAARPGRALVGFRGRRGGTRSSEYPGLR